MGSASSRVESPSAWAFPPFSATRDGGYIYGRGTIDDKDNVVASLMTMLLVEAESWDVVIELARAK